MVKGHNSPAIVTAEPGTALRETRSQDDSATSDVSSGARMGKRRKPGYSSSYSPSKRGKHCTGSPFAQNDNGRQIYGSFTNDKSHRVEQRPDEGIIDDGGGGQKEDHSRIVNRDEVESRGSQKSSGETGMEGTRTTIQESPPNGTSKVDSDEPCRVNNDPQSQRHELQRAGESDSLTGRAINETERYYNSKNLGPDSENDNDQVDSSEVESKYWTRKHIYPVLDLLSRQILTLIVDAPRHGSDESHAPNASRASQKAWCAVRSLFRQAISIVNEKGPFINDPGFADAGKPNERLLWRINATLGLCLLFATDRGYDDTEDLHARFTELFFDGKTELEEWQMALLLDVKQELRTLGIRENRFTQTESLRNRFLANRDPMENNAEHQDAGTISKVQDQTTQFSAQKVDFDKSHGERLKLMAQEILRSIVPLNRKGLQLGTHSNSWSMDPVDTILTSTTFGHLQSLAKPNFEVSQAETNPAFYEDQRESNKQVASAVEGRMSDRSRNVRQGDNALLQPINASTAWPEDTPLDAERHNQSPDVERSLPFEQLGMGQSASTSTQEQYEQAKLSASAKAAARNKGIPLQPSQRRPWSPEEENALMTGLDRVQGPHWSQILAMYGPGGSISEILKDRNQVQLKDKARNLKLFFLKSGHEVPHYLKNVTGELKTRAPTQAVESDDREQQVILGNATFPEYYQKKDLQQGNSLESCSPERVRETRVRVTEQDARNHEQRRHREEEDEDDLSNAIQLALRAIQEKNSMHQLGDDEGEGKAGKQEELGQHHITART